MRKYIAEAIGTFALVFCGTGAIIINQETNGTVSHVGIAITFGLIVMAMIYTLGHISGAHLNPAVSIAFTIARRLSSSSIISLHSKPNRRSVDSKYYFTFSFSCKQVFRRNYTSRK